MPSAKRLQFSGEVALADFGERPLKTEKAKVESVIGDGDRAASCGLLFQELFDGRSAAYRRPAAFPQDFFGHQSFGLNPRLRERDEGIPANRLPRVVKLQNEALDPSLRDPASEAGELRVPIVNRALQGRLERPNAGVGEVDLWHEFGTSKGRGTLEFNVTPCD